MKVDTKTLVTHTLRLDEAEQFRVTSQTKRPVTISVRSVQATNEYSGRWDLELHGHKVRQDGTAGQFVKFTVWTLCEGMDFKEEDRSKLWALLPPEVQSALVALGVDTDLSTSGEVKP